MFPFDAILFDVGGVLLTNGWDHRERAAVFSRFHLDRTGIEAHHAKIYNAWERGEITADEYLDAAVFYEPRSFTREEFFDAICAQSTLLPDGALGILKELAASHKCRLGLLNNEARETNEYRFDRFGIRAFAEFAFTSCYMGMRKPDPVIYERVLGILGVAGDRTLFIDDREENVAGALTAGMKAIRFTGEAALRSELQTLKVL
jgi:putative hydrolase of the HAD superfamily